MACRVYSDGTVTAVVCTRGRRPAPCDTCGKPHVALCDYPLKTTPPRTCDKKICASCRKPMPGEVDYCPAHRKLVEKGTQC